MDLPEKIQNVVTALGKLPGVGEKTALRHALYITTWNGEELSSFAEVIDDLKNLNSCKDCGLFTEEEICRICSNEQRKGQATLCVIESISDCLAIERSGNFKGMYHILGGVLNPLLGIGPDELNLDNFFGRVKTADIKNVILAINPSVEGDATCSYIRQELPDDVNVDRIGFGVPIGGNLEYLDAMTISKALENRRKM